MSDFQNAGTQLFTQVLFDSDGRLRSGWRFFVYFSLFLVAVALAGGFAGVVFSLSGLSSVENAFAVRIIQSAIGLAVALLVGWLCVAFIEKLPYRSLGAAFTNNWLKDLTIGIAGGLATFCIAVGIAVVFGGLRFQFNSEAAQSAIISTLALTSVTFFLAAAFEEALVRGYMFQTFVRSGLWWVAIILTAVIFAAGHLGNEGATVFSTVNTALAGIWLGVGYLKTRTLWFVSGVHFAWNWVQGSVFGIEVSGFDNFASAPVLLEIDKGPAWISGGEYGIEGGIACTIALIVSTVLIWYAPFLRADEEMLALTSPNQNPEKDTA